MAQAKKFGTFGGVFTPSILTILGVIMYLRLGWVVGQAGLIASIAIILIAHIISVTTGLSVSSVATDKKVKAGGLYYMLSRSLGLPIGGSIGIALYVATALSISLYIVGFSESFNSVVGFTLPETSGNNAILNLRITGTITLIIITSVALISTSLAIKTQFYIMGAIFLSIISIIAGSFFMEPMYQAETMSLSVLDKGVELERVFEIFFPAVTGFTAGVAMSGDLKDPKKSIPSGTMAAIAVGLIVYLGLAVFLSGSIGREFLISDYNILAKISLFAAYGSPLVISGIWGATLSSALGGILGGPRILQAMSFDKIPPWYSFFSKGVGKENEPRNALILTFVIAEFGVLIGELDIIAPIVSMFYLTAYGFINLTCALESWSSSDFRPQFKIPRWVSIIGALATFGVMFKLNTAAMFISFLIIALIFFYLTKKQINLGFSNIWQGVYAEVVRRSLFKIGNKEADQRNWRPNILLFSGAANQREYLVDFGAKLVGRLGLISNFNVVERKNSEGVHKTDKAIVENDSSNDLYRGVFTRQQFSKNIYDGMGNIAENYGFSGIEPNTILIGWARGNHAENEFVPLLQKFNLLDFNLLVMDYEKQLKFGKKQNIDIWWEGNGRNLSFILTMIRFLTSTDDWLNAKVRIVIHLSSIDADGNEILRNLNNLLEEYRLSVEIKTINAILDSRPLYELIKSESAEADLIFTELLDIDEKTKKDFYSQTTKLCNETGTIVLYRGSSSFRDVQIGVPVKASQEKIGQIIEESKEENEEKTLVFSSVEIPENEQLAEWSKGLSESIEQTISTFYIDYLKEINTLQDKFYVSINTLVEKTENQLKNRFKRRGTQGKIKVLELHTFFLEEFQKLIYHFRNNDLSIIEKKLDLGGQMFKGEISYLKRNFALKKEISFDYYQLKSYRPELLKHFGFLDKIWARLFKKPLNIYIDFEKVCAFYFYKQLTQNQYLLAGKQATDGFKHMVLLQKYMNVYFQKFNLIEQKFNDKTFTFSKAHNEIEQLSERLTQLKAMLKEELKGYKDFLISETTNDLNKLTNNLDNLHFKQEYYRQSKTVKSAKENYETWLEFPKVYAKNLSLYIGFFNLDISMKLLQNSLRERLIKYNQSLSEKIHRASNLPIKQLQNKLRKLKQQLEKQEEIVELPIIEPIPFSENGDFDQLLKDFKLLTTSLPYEMEIMDEKAMNNLSPEKLEELPSMSFSPSVVANYHLQISFIEPLIKEMQVVREEMQKAPILIKDVSRLINFGIENINTLTDLNELENARQELLKLIIDELTRLRQLASNLKKTSSAFVTNTDKLVDGISDKFNAYNMVKSADNIGFNLRTRSREKALSKMTDLLKSVKDKGVDSFTQLIYRRSEGLLVAKRLRGNRVKGALVEGILNLKDRVAPDKEALAALPYYYKQLFLSGHLSGEELWYGRKRQLSLGEKAINRFKSKNSGAILISGMPRSGKSFMADYLANKHFDKESIYKIEPPLEGSIEPKDLRKAIAKKIKLNTRSGNIMNQVPQGSVLIIEDLERWWLRIPDGYQVVHSLIELINQYSHSHLFVVIVNPITYRFVNKVVNLEDCFMQILDCDSFDARSLKDIILLRHHSSGMKFRLGEQREEKVSNWKLANFFASLFDVSQGNIGNSLQTWISSLRKVEDNILVIEQPKLPPLDVLRRLPSSWVIILIQLLLHRQLTIPNLQKVMNCSLAEIQHNLIVLKRSGLVEEERGVLVINRYMENLLLQVFSEDGIL